MSKLTAQEPVHASTLELGKERLEGIYRSEGYRIENAAAEEPDDSVLAVPDVKFQAIKNNEAIIVALVGQNDKLERLHHLHELQDRIGKRYLRVHPLELPQNVRSVRKSITWFLAQGPVLTVMLTSIGAVGAFLIREF